MDIFDIHDEVLGQFGRYVQSFISIRAGQKKRWPKPRLTAAWMTFVGQNRLGFDDVRP